MAKDPVEILNQRNAEVEKIRGFVDLTEEAKQRRIDEVNARAKADYQQAIEDRERDNAQRLERAEKELFRFRYPSLATDAEKAQIRAAYRAAYNDVYYSVAFSEGPWETDEELERLLERAERTGDPELAEAVYHVATEKGSRKVADAYLASRPQERQRWEAYVAARQEAESVRSASSLLERSIMERALSSAEQPSAEQPPQRFAG